MNRSVRLLLLSIPISAISASGVEPRVQDFALDDHTVYSVPVSATRVTTISFPSPVTAIDGALLTLDGKTSGLFQIAHAKGTAFLSLRALSKDAATNLNVRWNNRTYAFELHESAEPWYSVVLRSGPETSNRAPRPLTPARLLGLIDKAKAFALLQKQQPEAIADVEYADHRDKPIVSDCGDYQVRMTEVFRFPENDAIVFHLVIENRSDKPLDFTPEKLEVRVGDRLFNPSLTDLVSGIAPHESTIGYAVVSSEPDAHNNLSLKNDFTFVLSRREPSVENTADPKDIEPAPLPQ
ncbi:MAG: hypothetical protein JO354_08225 [Verrucomicrobia bacterium]|nr:hypothetical protein [Verrucomicrobiota bacterium]